MYVMKHAMRKHDIPHAILNIHVGSGQFNH
jgi:hypothetical protein